MYYQNVLLARISHDVMGKIEDRALTWLWPDAGRKRKNKKKRSAQKAGLQEEITVKEEVRLSPSNRSLQSGNSFKENTDLFPTFQGNCLPVI